MPSPAAGQGLPPEWEQVLPPPQNCTAPAEPPHSRCHCSSVPKWGILLFRTAEHPEILTHHSGSCGISGLENEVICLFSWNSISGTSFEMLVWNPFLSPWMCLNCSSIWELLMQLICVLTTILPRVPCQSPTGLLLRQEGELCSEIRVLCRSTLVVLFTILQWEQFLVNLFAFPAVCCWIDPVGGHPKCTYSTGHRPQWGWMVFPGFPHSWLKDWDLENRHQVMTLANPPQCASHWCAWSFLQFRSLSVVKFKDYLNRRSNFFPMTSCLWTLVQWEFWAPMSYRPVSFAFCSKLWLLLL